MTGVLLAIARISGETAPLLFTALNNQFFSTDLNAPMASLPVVIFQFALTPYDDWQRLAWAGALLITVAVLTLNIVARSLDREKIAMDTVDAQPPPVDQRRWSRMPPSAPTGCRKRSSIRNLEFFYGKSRR